MERRAATVFSPQELILIRHGRAETGGRLCGRVDVDLAAGAMPELEALGRVVPEVAGYVVSPALRCRRTVEALWPGVTPATDARLWEQDFGEWDGMAFADVPNAGEMDREALADFAAPGGESFRAMYERVVPALREAADRVRVRGPVAVVAHAGTVRAALSLALGEVSAGLAFEIEPASVTRFRVLPGGQLSIVAVNWRPS